MARLKEALELSFCEYCETPAYRPCVSHNGNETSHHIARLHAAHKLLVDIEQPMRASKLNIARPHQGHNREDWNRRQAEKMASGGD